jgi:hypothetical protein
MMVPQQQSELPCRSVDLGSLSALTLAARFNRQTSANFDEKTELEMLVET